MKLPQKMFDLLEKNINYYLRLDPNYKHRLQPLEGKIVFIDVVGLPVSFYLYFEAENVRCFSELAQTPHAKIRGSLFSLFKMSVFQKTPNFSGKEVEIEGDAEIGLSVKQLLTELEIDWEEQFSKWIGDIPAHALGNFARKAKSWFSKNKQNFEENLTDYLQEEMRMTPTIEAVEDFYQKVDQLRMDVDRLEARLNYLLQQSKSKS